MKSLKHQIQSLFNQFGLEIRRQQPETLARCSMDGCLMQAKKNGLTPKTVIDVGAAVGTPALYHTFPEAHHVLIEPLKENVPQLEQWVRTLKSAQYVLAVAASQSGQSTINVHPDLVGSSLYLENEDSDVNGIERVVPAITLDQLQAEHLLHEPYLIKIDTQGSELEVLKGANAILEETEMIILEVTFFNFFAGAPTALDYIKFMQEKGFVIYEIFDIGYRLLDDAMSQVDIAFVKENSVLRKFHHYASKEQREKQNQLFLEALKQPVL